ncbi:glycosyltransferase family protein [Halpernia frigidisoli]|uniref:Glycosyl transferase family 2 n=1 Tax=Halpernia frigidisoli TaxID=1125876 RepID=A0A1I3GM97_9FLAO|nr:hypothetical protein [Halpernia frigidisoli]SFI24583.1 hypothetical protein SAMN05443292_1921 [Halpernia frigidisoli]
MTDILIKSFNRPFYLDRCLFSIFKFVEGDFKISVLDDGTPKQYLDKIRGKYPEIDIILSKNYAQKTSAITENLKNKTEINGFQIPVDLWIEAAKNASDYFIITEDDVWFTEKININDLVSEMKKSDINLLKLGWLGNFKDDQHLDISEINNKIDRIIPHKLFLKGQKTMEAFFLNKYKFYSFLYKLKIVNNETPQKYWALNSILMGLYSKKYWLKIWKNMAGKVDEKQQLINASVYFKKNKNNLNFIARLKKESMKTTFQSSATNSYHNYGYNFDVNLFNYLINEAWFTDKFDSFQNFPNDFSLDYFESFFNDKIDILEFKKWVSHFKEQYKNLGVDVG